MSIGNDVYADTRLIIQQLEARFPENKLGSTDAAQRGVEHLLRRYITDAGIFMKAAALIPPEMPLLKDPNFQKDREQMTGRKWSQEAQAKGRPEALAGIRDLFELLENDFLSDGRQYILDTKSPMLADVETSWVITWLMGMPGSLPKELFGKDKYPKTYAWVDRFNAEVKQRSKKPTTVKGEQAKEFIMKAKHTIQNVDETDPLGLKTGDDVTVYPLDSGFRNKDSGRLVTLNSQEVGIEIKSNEQSVVLHAPRWGFRVEKGGSGSKL